MAIDQTQIEATLTRQLSSRLEGQEISQLAELIAALAENGIEVDDVFPYGISQPWEGISIRGHLTAEQLNRLGDMIPKLAGVRDYRIFPRGIIAPERYRMHVNLQR